MKDKIIEKQDEKTSRTELMEKYGITEKMVTDYLLGFIKDAKFTALKAEDEQPDQEIKTNFMQIRDLTDEEWMKLPKKEIFQLYKNCYSMLIKQAKQPDQLPGTSAEETYLIEGYFEKQPIERHLGELPMADFTSQSNLRDILIKFYEWETDYPNYASNKREVPDVIDVYLKSL